MADGSIQPDNATSKSDADADKQRAEKLQKKREQQRVRGAKYYQANKEKVKARSAAWVVANKDQALATARAWRSTNKGKIRTYREGERYQEWKRAYDAEYYAANKEKMQANMKAYYASNSDRLRAQNAEYRAAHPDREKTPARVAYQKAWRVANKDKMRAYGIKGRALNGSAKRARRRARLKDIPGSYTQAEVKALFLRQMRRCACYGKHAGCLGVITLDAGKKNTCHCDHIIPLTLPGSTNFISNIQLTCGPCNRQKSALDPVDFARRLGLLL